MEKSRRFKILLSMLFVLFLLSFSSVYMFLNRETNQEVLGVQDNFEEESEMVSTGIPYILSEAPLVAHIGEYYEYVPRLVDIDNDISELTLELTDGPEWLHIVDGIVVGLVPDTPGTFSFILRVSDGYNTSELKNYILVEHRNE